MAEEIPSQNLQKFLRKRIKVKQPSSGALAPNNKDFGASLVKGNLESDALKGEADFRDIAAMEKNRKN